ncbi:IPP transferase-domain-containing protein [Microdochium trichocladiopsis]|uniref:tRNA dimethylallyltransferase n=1 Tax=Microdochium trichocladiopsis TaxID=1682393 RepID=A0A9P8Y7K3_9PEZI|nr:IPP transferase-domain-containing protein [Microdochium trichocladiopsis]KAH7033645.1 IPP transferase-domain-containing protein [Microdochium trichocladiopsis]
MPRIPPSLPLVAVMGTTGTGKSDLAVDLAVRFNGEVINADAMQMYKGLPIITNQISEAEQRGIPHHMLAAIDHGEPTWTVTYFAREARRIIQEIRSRGKLPIVVGGTHYYINSLLFDDTIVAAAEKEDEDVQLRPQEETIAQFPILDEPTDVMFKKLQEVDPAMAERWHPDDRRKIKRSLEIFLTTGKRASEIYAQQQADRMAAGDTPATWEALMFWVYSKPEVLNERLNTRIDKMEQRGLMGEVRQLAAFLNERSACGEEVDQTRGIWQSIGFKQMEPLLQAEKRGSSQMQLDRARAEGLELMRIATRQYAKSQIKWLRNKTGPELREKDALPYLFVLDSSDVDKFSTDVLQPAADVLQCFLAGEALPQPQSLSSTARDVLAPFMESEKPAKAEIKTFRCDDCHLTLVTEAQWNDHITGRKHQRVVKNKKRKALVPVPDTSKSDSDEVKSEDAANDTK